MDIRLTATSISASDVWRLTGPSDLLPFTVTALRASDLLRLTGPALDSRLIVTSGGHTLGHFAGDAEWTPARPADA